MDQEYQRTDDIFSDIIRCYHTLTRSEVKVADYILSNKMQIHSLSISELSAACDVSDATVSRFCHSIGCSSFNELKLAVVQALSSGEMPSTAPDLYGAIAPGDSIRQKCQKLCSISTQALQQTLELMDDRQIRRAVELFTDARAIYCYGQGNSSIVAEDAWGRFTCVSPKFHYISNTRLQANTAALLGKDDVILYFSFSGAVPELSEVGQIIEKSGAKLILVTRFPNSPGAKYADLLLICGANEAPHQQGSIAAKIGQLFIVDVLFHEFCSKNGIPITSADPRRT